MREGGREGEEERWDREEEKSISGTSEEDEERGRGSGGGVGGGVEAEIMMPLMCGGAHVVPGGGQGGRGRGTHFTKRHQQSAPHSCSSHLPCCSPGC